MRALVTRPAEDSAPLVAALRARGIDPVAAPLLRIEPSRDGAARLAGASAGVQAILFTSANAVRAFAAAGRRFELPAFCVGEASAAAARIAGFRTVFSADGDAADLAALVAARLAPDRGALLHAAGAETAGDLGVALPGFTLHRVVLYRAVPAEALPPEAAAALRDGAIELALFFSPRTAATFVRVARESGIAAQCEAITALALSPVVAVALDPIDWRAVAIAAAPNLAALLAALDRTVAEKQSA